jgi:hypothetical protein
MSLLIVQLEGVVRRVPVAAGEEETKAMDEAP